MSEKTLKELNARDVLQHASRLIANLRQSLDFRINKLEDKEKTVSIAMHRRLLHLESVERRHLGEIAGLKAEITSLKRYFNIP